MANALRFAYEKLKPKRRARLHGTLNRSILEVLLGDPLVQERTQERTRQKVLNRQYRALRLEAEAQGQPFPSYTDWMQQQV